LREQGGKNKKKKKKNKNKEKRKSKQKKGRETSLISSVVDLLYCYFINKTPVDTKFSETETDSEFPEKKKHLPRIN
jgi:hypothetical protein